MSIHFRRPAAAVFLAALLVLTCTLDAAELELDEAALKQLASEDEAERLQAAQVIGVIKLRKALQSPNASTKIAAAKALGSLGTAAKDAIPSLTLALRDNDFEVQTAARAAMDAIHDAGKPKPVTKEGLKAKLEAHWKTVKIEYKPEPDFVTFEFEPQAKKVKWVAKVGEGTLKIRYYDITFFAGERQLYTARTNLKDMVRNTSVEDEAKVDSLRVTRIEISLKMNRQ